MGRANTATLDGRIVGYGTRDSNNPNDAVVHTYGRVQQAEIYIRPEDFASGEVLAADVENPYAIEIPAGASIKSAQFLVDDAFVGGTNLNIGTKAHASPYAVVDADGIDAAVLTAALTAGATIECDGAQVGGDRLAAAVTIVASSSGTYTAGSGRLVVEYYQPVVDQEAPAPLQGVQGSL